MSFVIGVAHKGQVIIKSDGRLVNKAEDRIVDEYYDKTRKISNKVICGFAGNKSLCEIILNTFSSSYIFSSYADDADNITAG